MKNLSVMELQPDGREYPLLFKTVNDIYQVLDLIRRNGVHKYTRPCLQLVYERVDNARLQLTQGLLRDPSVSWSEFYLNLGKLYIDLIESQSLLNDKRFADMLIAKHLDYGTRSLLRWSHVGIISRIDQKIARIENLGTKKERQVSNETMEDTIVDILGYICIGIRIDQLERFALEYS